MLNEFLEEYRRLEQLLKQIDKLPDTVLDLESILESEDSERLKVCRILRNYSAHHADAKKFINVADGTLSFMRGLNDKLEAKYLSIKSSLVKAPAVKDTVNIKAALIQLAKNRKYFEKSNKVPCLIVMDKTGKPTAQLTADLLAQALELGNYELTTKLSSILASKSAKAKTFIKEAKSFTLVESSVLKYSDKMLTETTVVVDKKGKYTGLVII